MATTKARQVKTSPTNLALIEKTLNKMENTMLMLYERWKDEKEYEDIEEYGDRLAKFLPKNFQAGEMTSKPFALNFSIGGQKGYQFYMDNKEYGWRRKII